MTGTPASIPCTPSFVGRLADIEAEALRLAGTRDVLAVAASVLADLGDTEQALAHLEAAGRACPPTHHLWQYAAEPQVLAPIESLRGNPAGALEILEISRPYELS
jgi:hypothetical protein